MKTLARTGAVLSLGFLSVPGLALIAHGSEHGEMGAKAFGCLFIGFGCFAGTLLWLLGEKFGANANGK
jgi:hypothetical protein